MSELRAGGMAMIIESSDESDIGKCVTCEQVVPARGQFKSPHGRLSENRGDHLCWLVSGDVKATMGEGVPAWAGKGWSLYPPGYLMPLDGQDFTEEERERENVL